MWYTVLVEEIAIGFVELPSGALVAAPMLRLPAYEIIGATTRSATLALLQVGLFGGALPPLPPVSRDLLRLRRCLSRGARLRIALVDARGEAVETTFVNLLQSAVQDAVVVVAGIGRTSAPVAAMRLPGPRMSRGKKPSNHG